MNSFSDFAELDEKPLDGDKVKIDNVLNKEIVILAYKVRGSKFKENSDRYATIQFKELESDVRKIIFSGSNVIIDLLMKYEKHLPFKTVIKKIDRYYTFS